MPFIAFLGCDGSGKSAVIAGVAEHLREKGESVTLGHWRPKPFASETTHSSAAEDPHGQEPRGAVGSILKLAWLWLNWWIAWLRHLGRESRVGYVLFDRYHGDLLVDPRRYRYGGPMTIARLAMRLMPQPDLVIFLDATPEVLLSRKQEVGTEALAASREEYLAFCRGDTRALLVDACQPLASVIAEAVRAVESTT
jgi:thymidylate kinase